MKDKKDFKFDDDLIIKPGGDDKQPEPTLDPQEIDTNYRKVFGDIVKVESIDNSDYIVVTTDKGEMAEVYVLKAWDRAMALLEMMENATKSFDRDDFERTIWLAGETFKACIKNLASKNPADAQHPTVAKFNKRLLAVEKRYKNAAEYKKKKSISMGH